MTRYASGAWLLVAIAGLVGALVAAGQPYSDCLQSGSSASICHEAIPDASRFALNALLGTLRGSALPLLFAYLVGVRRSRSGAMVAGVLGVLTGVLGLALIFLGALLGGTGADIGAWSTLAWLVLLALAGTLSILAARPQGAPSQKARSHRRAQAP